MHITLAQHTYASRLTVKPVVEWRHAGTEEERGIAKWREHLRGIQHKKEDDEASSETASDTYDLPCGMSLIRRWAIFKFIPFCPTFLVDVKREQTTNDDDIEGAGVTGSELGDRGSQVSRRSLRYQRRMSVVMQFWGQIGVIPQNIQPSTIAIYRHCIHHIL